MKLLKKALDISMKKTLVFPHEIYMVLLYSTISIFTTILFWSFLFSNISAMGYQQEFIYLMSMVGLFSDGIGEFFFGLRNLEYLIQKGELDQYLVRPQHPIYLLLLENIPMISILEKLALSILGILLIYVKYNLVCSFSNMIIALIFLICGVVYYQAVFAMISFLALWTENISSLRNLIFQVGNSKQYPISIFPEIIRAIMTYVIPVGLIAYYPTILLLGKEQTIPPIYFLLPVVLFAANGCYKKGIKRYTSNGG